MASQLRKNNLSTKIFFKTMGVPAPLKKKDFKKKDKSDQSGFVGTFLPNSGSYGSY